MIGDTRTPADSAAVPSSTPDDPQSFGGATYGAHRAFLRDHARAYAAPAGALEAEEYAEHYVSAYGSEPLESCADHCSEWSRWQASR